MGQAKKLCKVFFKSLSILFQYLKKGSSKKLVQASFKICKYPFLKIWKKGQAKKCCQDFLRFVSIVFLIIKKGDKQKNCASIP